MKKFTRINNYGEDHIAIWSFNKLLTMILHFK